MATLYQIVLPRYIRTTEYCYPKLKRTFLDERGKLTTAKYKLTNMTIDRDKNPTSYLYRLDARSIRYMQRVRIIENTQEETMSLTIEQINEVLEKHWEVKPLNRRRQKMTDENKEEAVRTYLLELDDGTKRKITIPEHWKVMFFGGETAGTVCIMRLDSVAATFTSVVNFRDLSIEIEETRDE